MTDYETELRDVARLARLGRLAARYAWRGRTDPLARAVGTILQALHLAFRGRDGAFLARLTKVANSYLGAVGVPVPPTDARSQYERITVAVERAIAGVDDLDERRRRAARMFVVMARVLGFELPTAPPDDAEAIALCRPLLRERHYADDQERAEHWVRAAAKVLGRGDSRNAHKARLRKPRSGAGEATGTTLCPSLRGRSGGSS